MAIELKGAEQWGNLTRTLRAASKELQQELSKEVTKATKPIKPAIQQSVREALPHRGGLNERVAQARFRTVRRLSGIRFQMGSSYALQQIDKGVVRHPVFGNSRVWVAQAVPAGSITRGFNAAAPAVQQAIQEAMDITARKVQG